MRKAFVETVMELAARDSRVVLLTGDLGFNALESFAARFPDRFFNVGVAEQNMVGVATGMAEAGFLPFVYSIATFATLRPYEFIRNGPALHHLPVRIVGMGGGFEYGTAGATHHALEDVAVMRVQPSLTVIAPADHEQTRSALLASWDLPGPIYYRLGKDDHALVPGLKGRFELGRTQLVREGTDLLFLTLGAIASEAVSAAERLDSQGISCAVAVISSPHPSPTDDLLPLLGRYPHALTVEAHYVNGGIGSLVAEIIAEHRLPCLLTRCAVKAPPDGESGSQKHMEARHRLSSEGLANTVLSLLQPPPARLTGPAPASPPASKAASDSDPLISIVLPVHNQGGHIRGIVESYSAALARLSQSCEILLVTNACRDNSVVVCRELAAQLPRVRTVDSVKGGWGLAVKLGLREARGKFLCYTNSARTTAADLQLLIAYAVANPDAVVKAHRISREALRRKLGSLAYNMECRMLFTLPTWDVNATPKVFSRETFEALGELPDGDLIDLQVCVRCKQLGKTVLEVPIYSVHRHGGKSTTNIRSAIGMYGGALKIWREMREAKRHLPPDDGS